MTDTKRLTDVQLKSILDALREKYPKIADRFGSDAGIELMNTDSRISEIIIEHYTKQDIPVLTIHDSYLIPHGLKDDLKEVMKQALYQVAGIDGGKMKEVPHRPALWNPVRSYRYRHLWEKFKIIHNKPDRAAWAYDAEW